MKTTLKTVVYELNEETKLRTDMKGRQSNKETYETVNLNY